MTVLNSYSKIVLTLRFFENFENGNYFAIESLLDEDYKLYYPASTALLNKDGFMDLMKNIRTSFPDFKITIDLQLADSDFVMTRFTFQAINKREFMGIPPTKKLFVTTGISVQRIKDYKIIEEHLEFDALGALDQLGAVSYLGQPLRSTSLVSEDY